MNNNIVIGGVLIVVLIVAGYLFMANRTTDVAFDEVAGTEEIMNINAVVEPTPAADSGIVGQTPENTSQGAVKEFTVNGSAFKFDPAEMRVKQGDTVRVTFKNSGGMHDWKVDEFNAATKVIQSGQQETIEFVASKVGQFEYYCSVANHRQMGMKGTLIVE